MQCMLLSVDRHTADCFLGVGVGHEREASLVEDVSVVFAAASSAAQVALLDVTQDLQAIVHHVKKLHATFSGHTTHLQRR